MLHTMNRTVLYRAPRGRGPNIVKSVTKIRYEPYG
jgi:hypothetical protein